MARNVIERELRTSKMVDGSHFVKIKIVVLIWNGKKWFLDMYPKWLPAAIFLKTLTKKVTQVIWTMFEPIAGRQQLDINSLLVNIYTDRYVGNEGTHCVRPLGRMHTILVLCNWGDKFDQIYYNKVPINI